MTSYYLNTDLCLITGADPKHLIAELGDRVAVLHSEPDHTGAWHVSLDAAESGEEGRTPAQDIQALLDAIEGIDAEAKSLWEGCARREFNIGWQAAPERPEGAFELEPELVRRIAALGGLLAVTIYPSCENDQ